MDNPIDNGPQQPTNQARTEDEEDGDVITAPEESSPEPPNHVAATLADPIQPVEEKKPEPPHQTNNHNDKIIIIKRIKKVVHKSHGGAWKIAYADFVTAMMTFFLLMWLLSMLNKYQLQGMSEYFKRPIIDRTAQKSDPKNDKIKDEDSSTTDKSTKDKKVNQASNIKEVPEDQVSRKTSEEIKNDLEKQMLENPKVAQYKNMLNFKVTSQGLKIELKDMENNPMFSSGKTDFAEYASTVLDWLSTAMNKYPNRVMIVGHTDSKPIQGSDDYTNWELSADRANAARRELVNNGMMPEKIVRIVGVADVDKLETVKTNDDPSNRRIEIVVLSDDAFKKMQNE